MRPTVRISLRSRQLVAGQHLPSLGQGLGQDKADEEDEEGVAAKRNVKDGDERSGPLDKVAGQQRAQRKAGIETGVDVANGHGSLGRGRAVAGVRLAEDTAGSKRPRDAIEEGAENHPCVVEGLRILGTENGDDLAEEAAARRERHQLPSAVPIRQMAQLRRDNGAQSADDEAQTQHEGGDIALDLWLGALRVVIAQDNRLIGEIRVQVLLIGKVLVAHQIQDSASPSSHLLATVATTEETFSLGCCLHVELGNDDAAKREGEDGIRAQQPEYLQPGLDAVSPSIGAVCAPPSGTHTDGLRHQGKCWKSRSLSQLSFLAPYPFGLSNWDVSVMSESRSSTSRIVELGVRPSLVGFGLAMVCM